MRVLALLAALTCLAACQAKPHRTTADGLPISDSPGMTGDGRPAGNGTGDSARP